MKAPRTSFRECTSLAKLFDKFFREASAEALFKKAGANALLATERCLASNRCSDFLGWMDCRGATA